MELKKYQKQVLGDLDAYLKSLDESNGLASAWSGYWSSKGPTQAAKLLMKIKIIPQPTGGQKLS